MRTKIELPCDGTKRNTILIHREEVKVWKEKRRDNLEGYVATDSGKERREYTEFWVVKIQRKSKEISDKIQRIPIYHYHSGFKLVEEDDCMELSFYDGNLASNMFDELEDIGLFKIIQKHKPNKEDWEEYGEILPMYYNCTGYQWVVNAVFLLLQSPFMIYRSIQRKRREREENEYV